MVYVWCIKMILWPIYLLIGLAYGMEVKPERAEIIYYNPKYVKYGATGIRPYGRNSGYYGYLKGYIYHTWGNNVTVDVVFNEYLHNEYRRSFIEAHYKLCKGLFEDDVYIGRLVRSSGISCPVPPGEHLLLNLSASYKDFPNVFPFRRGSVDILVTASETNEMIGNGTVYVTFEQKKKRKN